MSTHTPKPSSPKTTVPSPPWPAVNSTIGAKTERNSHFHCPSHSYTEPAAELP